MFCFKIGRHEVSQSILAKKSLYENTPQQSGLTTEQKTTSVTKVKKETVVITKKEVVVERRDAEARQRTDSGSSQGKQFVDISKVVRQKLSLVAS